MTPVWNFTESDYWINVLKFASLSKVSTYQEFWQLLLLIIDRAWKALKNLWKISQLRYPWAEKTLTLIRAGFLGPFSLLFNEVMHGLLYFFSLQVWPFANLNIFVVVAVAMKILVTLRFLRNLRTVREPLYFSSLIFLLYLFGVFHS